MNQTIFKTPILFIIFNREDTTQRVFETIRQQRPKYLFVAADGPRKNKEGEAEQCQRTRDIIKQIDWDCELKTLFHNENLGCKMAESSAMTWFFNQVEQGIVLEDDCLPDPLFFPYCEELLDRYKDDNRIGLISGNCFFPDSSDWDKDCSYNFCSISHTWGWASWQRVWKNYDVNFPYWEKYKHDKKKRNLIFNSLREKVYFSSFIDDTLLEKNKISTWEVQFIFMLRLQHQLGIYPMSNLVTNIGHGSVLATHITRRTRKVKKMEIPLSSISFPLKHPEYLLPNNRIYKLTMKRLFFSYKRLIRFILFYWWK
jgi:hypothetical protein